VSTFSTNCFGAQSWASASLEKEVHIILQIHCRIFSVIHPAGFPRLGREFEEVRIGINSMLSEIDNLRFVSKPQSSNS